MRVCREVCLLLGDQWLTDRPGQYTKSTYPRQTDKEEGDRCEELGGN